MSAILMDNNKIVKQKKSHLVAVIVKFLLQELFQTYSISRENKIC